MKATDTTRTAVPKRGALQPMKSRSAGTSVDVAGASDKGRVRSRNEDQFLIARLERSLSVLSSSLPDYLTPEQTCETVLGMVVADGIGGVAGGEVASRLAIRTLLELVVQTPDWIMRLDADCVEGVLRRQEERFYDIQGALRDFVHEHPGLTGMGTTLTLAASLGPNAVIAHIGDSRAYLHRGGELQRLTQDHTRAQALVDAGAIKPEQAGSHPMRHILTNAITAKDRPMRIQLATCPICDGDRLLLCTDGLTNMVSEEQIATVLAGPGSAQTDCEKLVRLALEAGGADNVTVVVARYVISADTH